MPPETDNRSKTALEAALSLSLVELATAGAEPALGVVPRVARVRMADYPQDAVFLADEVLASVVRAVHEPRPMVAALSFTPEDAMVLLRAWQTDPKLQPEAALECFKRAVSVLLDHALESLFQMPAAGDPAELREEGLVATLLSTHPKPDAEVFSAELGIATQSAAIPGVLTILTDSKSLEALD